MVKPSGMRVRLTVRAAGVLAAAFILAGCDGTNLFEGEVAEAAPEITALSVPASVETGATFTATATAKASRGIKFIEMRVSGAATDSIRTQFDGTTQTGTTSLLVTASSAFGSQVVINAFVQDINGRNSGVRSATVTVNPVSTGSKPLN